MGIERVESLRVQVAKQLRNQLRSGQMRPGQRLTEKGVASTLGVSRTPAREALSMLGENSVLELLANGGYAVPKITHDDINDVYEVRKLLEVAALKKAVKLADATLVDTLKRWLKLMTTHVSDFDTMTYFEAVVNFREDLFGGCGNVHLKRNILKVDNYTECLKSLALADIAVRKGLNESYDVILNAVIARDSKAAVQSLVEHHKHGILAYHAVLDQLASET